MINISFPLNFKREGVASWPEFTSFGGEEVIDYLKERQVNKMGKIKVKCNECKHEFWMEEWENKPCPKCGRVVKGPKTK